MKGSERSSVRAATLRAIGATALAAAATFAAGATIAAADVRTAPTIQTFATNVYGGSLAAGPDGAIWSFELRDGRSAVSRYGRSGLLSRAVAPIQASQELTPPTPQADGGMALVAVDWNGAMPTRLRVDASGRRVSAAVLPRSARGAGAFAVGADGEVWWVDACADALHRWRPGARTATVRTPRAVCDHTRASTLTIGPDGSVWLTNTRQGRIVRRDAGGRVRQWNVWPPADGYYPAEIAADPRGGSLAYSDTASWRTNAGLVTRAGRFVPTARGNPVFGPGGMLWRVAAHRVVSRTARGTSTRVALSRETEGLTVTIARDGSPWVTTGRLVTPISIGGWYGDVAVGTVRAGALSAWPVVADGRALSQPDYRPAALVLGGDGALWTWGWATPPAREIVRVVPRGLRAPRKPAARATGLLARNGRTVVVQVRCAAERGRFCRGTVRVGGATTAVRYVAPGQSGAAVSLTLTRRAVRSVRRRGALKTSAIVRSTGAGTTRATLRLRR